MDKLYFDGSFSGVSKDLRAEYSDLTNVVFRHLRGEVGEGVVRASLHHLMHTQSLEEGSVATTKMIKEQLRSCCSFWEDNTRYDLCWAVLEKLLVSEY